MSIELPPGGTQTILEEVTNISVDNGDHERFAHYVKKDKILQSALSGEEVIALCGKKWVPGRDPQKFPVCPECKKIYEGLPDNSDKDNGKDN
jgi:hypothetical protein